MKNAPSTDRLFALFFFLTGIFAIIGALFTWGEGWLFAQGDLNNLLIPIADLSIAGPLSLIAAVGIWTKKSWGIIFGSAAAGTYLYGSAMVYSMLFCKEGPYPLHLLIPPIFGMAIAISFLFWVIKFKKI